MLEGDTILEQKIDSIKERLIHVTPIIAVSGPSGAGKDYLTSGAVSYFSGKGIPTVSVQMVTDRPHRGEVETKQCVDSKDYDQLEKEAGLIGNHVNVYRYGYKLTDIEEAVRQAREGGGIVILELNPIEQGHFSEEILSELGRGLTLWIGVQTTEEQTRINMEDRGESQEVIAQRVKLIQDFNSAMLANRDITPCDNGPDNRVYAVRDFVNIIVQAILGE